MYSTRKNHTIELLPFSVKLNLKSSTQSTDAVASRWVSHFSLHYWMKLFLTNMHTKKLPLSGKPTTHKIMHKHTHTRTHTLVSWSNVPSGGFTYSYLSASAEGYMGQFRVAHYVSNQSKATFIKIFLTLHTVFQSNKHSSLITIIIHKQSICAVIWRKKKK